MPSHEQQILIDRMNATIGVVAESPHPVNKIAAGIAGADQGGQTYFIARTNHWPTSIENKLGRIERIGESSGTVHAETACILDAPLTQDASIFITDPFCPNCAKNMAEAGIARVYIDHKGFTKDFAERRGHHFKNMSLEICAKAGMEIYEINRKADQLTVLHKPEPGYIPMDESPSDFFALPKDDRAPIQDRIKKYEDFYGVQEFALAVLVNEKGERFFMAAQTHAAMGYSAARDDLNEDKHAGKYSFVMRPVNRILMQAARLGLKILDGAIYSSALPSDREQVNMCAAGLTAYYCDITGTPLLHEQAVLNKRTSSLLF